MEDIIRLLPDAIANQIAAGEVVQRPASVVKELLENSIDAGATQIKLIVKDSGKALIQVIDNGCGMSPSDARLSFERHATSKIRKADDLWAIRTMGFRGEALASIAAVAQVELKTKRADDELGTQILIQGSEITSQEPCACQDGTSFSVKNLFFNTPARRNFLKSDSVEYRHILDEFQRVALAHPDLFFSLHHNGAEQFHLKPGNLRQRILGVFGQQNNKHLVPVAETTEALRLEGYAGKPELSRKSRGDQYFFVNRRFIKSTYLHHAVVSAFEGLLPKENHPFYVIFIDIDPARIDVNVHPTKTEIKFDDEKLVYHYLRVATRYALGQSAVIPTLDFDTDPNFSQPHLHTTEKSQSIPGWQSGPDKSWTPASNTSDKKEQKEQLDHWQLLYQGLGWEGAESLQPSPAEATHQEVDTLTIPSRQEEMFGESAANWPDDTNKPPYQIHNGYIVSQIKSGFLVIDQHQAHERILYEQYLLELENAVSVSQRELFPRTFHLNPSDASIMADMLPALANIGFEIQDLGGGTFAVTGTPPDLTGGKSEKHILQTMLDHYKENLDLQLGLNHNLARSLARTSAIKRGQKLSVEEMSNLIDRLFACQVPYQCPRGKPTFITFDLNELQARFAGF